MGIAGAAVRAEDLKASQDVKTLEGQKLHITKAAGSVTVQKAKVIQADVAATNGVVHVINGVLTPPSTLGAAEKNIVELAAGIADLSTLVTALKAGKLVTALSGTGPFTVFAPTNEAFAALPAATLASLLKPANIKQLDAILEYHVIAGAAVRAENLKASQDVKTLEGQKLHITRVGGSVTVQKAKVITANVAAANGVVHVINGVLTPPSTLGSAVNTDSSLFNANLVVSGVAVHYSRDARGEGGNCQKDVGNVTIVPVPGNGSSSLCHQEPCFPPKGQLVASCDGSPSDGIGHVRLYCQVTAATSASVHGATTASAGALSLQAHFTIVDDD